MTSSRIYLLAASVGIAVVALLYFLMFGDQKKNWIVAGGEPGGNYAAGARALGSVLKKSKDWDAKVLESSGSASNIDLLATGKADLGFVQNDTPGSDDIRAVAVLYEETLHVLVRENNASVQDLAGKFISIGQVGSGTEGLAKAAFAQFGIPINMELARRESLRQGIASLRKGTVDATCVVTGLGNPVVAEALSAGGIRLLSLPAAASAHAYPFARTAVIPAGTYPVTPGFGLPKTDLPTIATDVVLACRAGLATDDVLELTKAVHEGRASLAMAHPLLARISRPEEKAHLQFPVHEGARQHYERDDPGFLQNWAEPMALLLSVLAIAWGVGGALKEFLLQRRKDSLDVYFEQVSELTGELVKGVNPERVEAISDELHAIRAETIRKLVKEELAANESFVIFQRQLHTAQQMVNETLRKTRKETKLQ